MRRLFVALALLAFIATATVSFAAPKIYQFTGTVKTVTAGEFTVEKSASDIWTFSTDAAPKGTPKIGDKVTVTYRMVAGTIEKK
jgi:hypothetical protein